MSTPAVINNNHEHIVPACLLTVVGGFLDVYTFLFRGEVFANAVTGNMVFCGLHIARAEWTECLRYLIAIIFYALGVLTAEWLRTKVAPTQKLGWHQIILALEIVCLLPIIFIPKGHLDFVVNATIAFICAMQVETFRKVHGLPFASTMCTGNLRSSAEALFKYLHTGDRKELGQVCHYYTIIFFFILGAVVAAILMTRYGEGVFFLAPAGLTIVFFMVSTRRLLGALRHWWRSLRPRS